MRCTSPWRPRRWKSAIERSERGVPPRSEAGSIAPMPTARKGELFCHAALFRCRPSQPVLVILVPGVPFSMNCIASKCDLEGSVLPTACTTPKSPPR